jgi:hypothetical protein
VDHDDIDIPSDGASCIVQRLEKLSIDPSSLKTGTTHESVNR